MTATVLVTGARGKTGREVVRQLALAPNIEVKAGSTLPDELEREANVRPVLFDWLDEGTWRDAVAGVDVVYLMRPDLEDAEELIAGLVRLRQEMHVVLLSEQSTETSPADAWGARAEKAVTENADRWTILRPSWFFQGLTDERLFLVQIRESRTTEMPSAGALIAWVDARDVASVAAKVILDPAAHDGKHYTVTGPVGLTMAEVAALVSAVTDAPVVAVDQPLADALAGLDGWLADMLESLYVRVQQGGFGDVTDTVESLAGVAPRSLEDFVSENRAAWGLQG